MKWTALLIAMMTLCSGLAIAGGGIVKKRPRPYQYGQVVFPGADDENAPVTFDHWSHRARVTCRVCHLDIGFIMQSGATEFSFVDNAAGRYCGTCHSGEVRYGGRSVFASCEEGGDPGAEACRRCHRIPDPRREQERFARFAAGLPRERFGNGIDWDKAEAMGLINPESQVEGLTIARKPFVIQEDFNLESRVESMPDILFSHRKHTVWNGCQSCHPDLFLGVKKGLTKYSMVELFEGKYCGACHGKVAFPQSDCQRCHADGVM